MPAITGQVKVSPRKYMTNYTDVANTTRQLFTFSSIQNQVSIRNNGVSHMRVYINDRLYVVTPGNVETVNGEVDEFYIESDQNGQPFQVSSTELTDIVNGIVGGHVYNVDIGLRKFRAARAEVAAVTGTMKHIVGIGDSITVGGVAGAGLGVDNTKTKYLTNGFLGRIRAALTAKYGDVGTGFIPCYYPSVTTPDWTYTGAWTDDYSLGVTGLAKKVSASGATITGSFNGTGFSTLMVAGPVGGTFSVSIDGGAAVDFDTYSATLINAKKFDINSLAAGDHTVTITSTVTGGKSLWFLGASPYKGTTGIRVHTLARWGIPSSSASTEHSMYASIDIWNPVLTIIALGANDFGTNVPPNTFKTNMQAIITRAKQYGDVLLVSTGLRSDVASPAYPQTDYIKVMKDLALSNNVAFVDIFNRWGGNASVATNTYKLISSDLVHPNDVGHQDIADAALNVLLS